MHLIENCFVTDSSGCHRYDFWNEQALFDGRPDTGWCPPSRTEPFTEYLDIDLGSVCTPVRIRIQRRPAPKVSTGFPPILCVVAFPDGQPPRTVLSEEDIQAPAGGWWEHDLEPVPTRRLRLEAPNRIQRPNGTYVLQFMQLQLLEQ
ncbi:hypothetical protein FHX82_007291 [Amycolatopsis bartoniae]|uniref:discoidin domain-containing protein n=1 Tax=Amycolatopsis bartoniae TaxID=941986 RepID=UPI0016056B76|nr:discoidin domain-containing protein [Amycolatopsis bartoniae]MBB2940205.1 hypothetical protein [Amycolatopsis bartoniae]